MGSYVADTRWGNVGIWLRIGIFPSLGLKTPWGNVIIKPWRDRLYHERYGAGPKRHFKLSGLCVAWVRLKRFAD